MRNVRQALGAMASYLDSESLRRQSRFFLQLTVVTICFMVGAITATFLGMNVLDFAGTTGLQKVLAVALVFTAVVLVTTYTIMKSRRLAGFLDTLSDERLPLRAKAQAFLAIWRREGP